MYHFLILVFMLLPPLTGVSAQNAAMRFEHGGTITAAGWNSDESQLFTAGDDGRLILWDAASGDILAELQHDSPLLGAIWGADGRLLTWQENGLIALWDTNTLSQLWQVSLEDAPQAVLWDDQQPRILAYTQHAVGIWSLDDGALLFTVQTETPLASVNWSGEDAVYLFDEENDVRRFAISSGEVLSAFSLQHRGMLLGARLNQDETRLLTWHVDGFAIVWRIAGQNAERIFSFRHRTFVSGARWNADETRVMTWAADDTVKLWDAQTGEELRVLSHPDWADGALWNSDERYMLTWAHTAAYIWDENGLVTLFQHPDLVRGALWNSQGDHVLTWAWDGVARLWPLPQEGD